MRSCTLFRLLSSQVRAQQNRLDLAVAEAEQLVRLPEVRELTATASTCSSGGGFVVSSAFDPLRLTDDDRVAAFVLLSSLLSRSKRLKEAQKVLSEAKVIFAGSKQEVQVLVAASQLAVEKNDYGQCASTMSMCCFSLHTSCHIVDPHSTPLVISWILTPPLLSYCGSSPRPSCHIVDPDPAPLVISWMLTAL